MEVYEITAAGFDGGSDDTDHLVLWVMAETRAEVESLVEGTGARLCGTVSDSRLSDLDYILNSRASADKFRAHLLMLQEVALKQAERRSQVQARPGREDSTIATRQGESRMNANMGKTVQRHLKGSSTAYQDLMQAIFRELSNPDDWKAPIDCIVPFAFAATAQEAITFITGTVPNAERLPTGEFRLTSVGYRMGPCGDR